MYTIVLNVCDDVRVKWACISVASVFLLSPAAILPVKLIGLVWISFSAGIPGMATDPRCILGLIVSPCMGQYCPSAAKDTTVSCLPISSKTAASMLRFPSGKFCASQRSRITPVGLDLVAK